MNKSVLFIFDIDNTLLESYDIYDEAYRLTSKEILGKEFIMTKNPDGSKDNKFSRLSNNEILEKRIKQLRIKKINSDEFFSAFDKNAETLANKLKAKLYPWIKEFLSKLSKNYELIILSSGTKKLQISVLKNNDLVKHFNIKDSLFLGDFNSKKEAIEHIFNKDKKKTTLIHVGDSPNDMKAIKEANLSCKKIAIGVTLCGFVNKKVLLESGADLVINEYNAKNLNSIKKLILS